MPVLRVEGWRVEGGAFVGACTIELVDRSDPSTPSPAVPPAASVLPPSQVVHLNHSANLTCVATGKPQPQLSWLHNGAPIEGSSPGVTLTPTSLFITMATAEDAGVYTCSADNGIGRVIAMATVTVLCESPAILVISVSSAVVTATDLAFLQFHQTRPFLSP